MTRILRHAAWWIAATILLSGLSFAQNRYDDDGYQRSNDQWHDRRGYYDDRDNDRRYDRDPRYRDSYGYSNGGNWGGSYGRDNRGFSFGFQDGAYVAREDMALGKPYHPEVRGKYRDADRGYDRYWGDKREYRAQYADGYRRGYMRAFRSRY
ncbi:MAG TPA: hypothetical protein VH088_24015 [Terriglobales bacterium]|nr:hypothetical protein [Terriglobales bacterium]